MASPTVTDVRRAAPTALGLVWDNLGMVARSRLLLLMLVGLALAAGITVSFMWRQSRPAQDLVTGSRLSPSRALPDFTLIDHEGRPFGLPRLRGHWTLMFFGYTNCPDFCPATLTTLAALEKRLRDEQAPVLPQVVFMSVDAKRDTPAQLARYVPYFDPSFVGVTAVDQPAIEAVALKLGVSVIITPSKEGTYTVDHSGDIFVVDPSARLAAVLTGPFTVPALAGDWRRLVTPHS
jgi:protein SCO1/2